jgi:hypothetical protein
MKLIQIALMVMIFVSCESHQDEKEPTPIDLDTEQSIIQDAILSTQQLLIGKLMSHVDSLDLEPAVRFCAENAQRLTDSISNELGYTIRRVSPKNRNSLNAASQADLMAYKHFENSISSGKLAKYHFDDVNQTYYAPIVLGMPLCLQCHGKLDERNTAAYALIQEFYPTDLAVDYDLGDLRGMWRVGKK